MIVTRWQAQSLPTLEQIKMIFEAEGFEPYHEEFAANSHISDHRHPFDEIRMVAKGVLLLDISGNKLLLRAGDRIQIPANTKHSYTVEGSTSCVCVCANQP